MYNISLPFENSYIHIQFNSKNIHIIDSFRVKRKRDMEKLLSQVEYASFERGIFYSRDLESWIQEWKAHNVLYNLGICKERTKSVDLNENENKIRKFGYFILSLFSLN